MAGVQGHMPAYHRGFAASPHRRVLVHFNLDGKRLGRTWREPELVGQSRELHPRGSHRLLFADLDLDPVTFAFEDPLERDQGRPETDVVSGLQK